MCSPSPFTLILKSDFVGPTLAHLFSFNACIQIPLPPMDERKKVVEDVDKDRRYAIDASIVRIMKSRKVLGYQQLITECVEQLSRMFKVYLSFINNFVEGISQIRYFIVAAVLVEQGNLSLTSPRFDSVIYISIAFVACVLESSCESIQTTQDCANQLDLRLWESSILYD